MSTTGLDVFDTTVQKTNTWLKDLMQVMDWDDRHRAYVGMRAALHALATACRWKRWRGSARNCRYQASDRSAPAQRTTRI